MATPRSTAPVGPADDPPRYAGEDVALLALLGVAWGVAYVFIREGIVLGATPLLYAAVRYALSAASFAAIALVRRAPRPSARGLGVSALVGGILVIGCYGGFLYWGEQFTSGGFASVLSTTAPILTVVVAYALLPHERLSPASLAGLAVAFVGVVVLVLPTLGGGWAGWRGPAFVIAAFVSAAFGTVLLRRFGGGPQGLWQIGAQFAVGAAFLGVGVSVLPVPEALPLRAAVLGDLAALVGFSSVVGYFAYFRLHHRVGPVRANSVAYLLPIVGVGVGSGWFGEPISWPEVVGCAIVLSGMTLIVRGSLHRSG